MINNQLITNSLLQESKKAKTSKPEGTSSIRKTQKSRTEIPDKDKDSKDPKDKAENQALQKQTTEVGSDGVVIHDHTQRLTEKYHQLLDIDVSFDMYEQNEFKDLLYKKENNKKLNLDPYKDVYCEKSCFIFSKKNKIRKICAYLGSHSYFETVVIIVIILSSLKLVIETYETDYWTDTTKDV